MKNLFQEIREWKHDWKRYIKYSWKFTVWIYIARWRRVKIAFNRNFDLLLRTSFVVLGLTAGLFLYFFGSFAFTQETLSNYLVSVGAMMGGVIAIVFTISIFLLQNAANLYSSQYLEVYIHDWKEKIIYLCVVLITILFFGTGLYVGGLEDLSDRITSLIVLLSLTFIGVVFALIDWQYKTVRKKISPTETITFLEQQGLAFLSKLEDDAKRTAELLETRDPDLSKDEALARTYNTFFQPSINNLNRQIENLVEISLRLADNQETETVKRGFNSVHNLLLQYLDTRKTSTLTMPSGIAFMATETDSQRFLFNNFDRLNKAGEKFINEGKDELATHFIGIYDSLAEKSTEMTFVGNVSRENPVFDTITGSFRQYIDIGIRAKNLEVVFQSIDKLGNMAIICAREGYASSLTGIEEKIYDIAFHGILVKQTIITDQCNKNYLNLLVALFGSKKIIRKLHFSSVLRHIAETARYLFVATQSGHIAGGIGASFALSKAYDSMYEHLVYIINLYAGIDDERERTTFIRDYVNLIKEINTSLRHLSEELNNCDNTVTESIGRLLQNINDLIVSLATNEDFSDVKDDLLNHLSWNLHLPYWFAHHSKAFDSGSNKFRSLIESVARAGIQAIDKLDNKKLAESAIDSINSIVEQALEKSPHKHGFDEPRLMKRICYLGILALKKGWDDVFAEACVKIIIFEPKYKKKYFSNVPAHIDIEKLTPSPDRLFDEVFGWRGEFDHDRLNGSRMMDDAEDMMYSLITIEDIDRFTFRVWQKWDASSSISDELEKESKKLALKNQRKKLVKVLSEITHNE